MKPAALRAAAYFYTLGGTLIERNILMKTERVMPLLAAFLMVIFFIGAWVLGHFTGLVVFRNLVAVIRFLVVTTSLLIFQVIISSIPNSPFRLIDHGFQLCVISVVCLVTLIGTSNLGKYNYENLDIALAITLALLVITLYVNIEERKEDAKLAVGWRLLNYCMGVLAIETYIVVSINGEVTTWNSLFYQLFSFF